MKYSDVISNLDPDLLPVVCPIDRLSITEKKQGRVTITAKFCGELSDELTLAHFSNPVSADIILIIKRREYHLAASEPDEPKALTNCRDELEQERVDCAILQGHLRDLLHLYCLVQRCELGHPCPENISTLKPMYDAISQEAKATR